MPNKSLDDFVKQSQFVFSGVVERPDTTALTAVSSVPNVALVRVHDVLHGPAVLRGFIGKHITLLVTQSGELPGKRAIFFATSWLYGESLAVIEIGRIDDGDYASMKNDIDDAYRRLADERLLHRLTLAERVIMGRVVKATPVPAATWRSPKTEHTPDWWEAIIEVESVEKGHAREGTVSVLFPKSLDEAWITSPKFAVGQEGVWILQRDQKEKGSPALRTPGLTALDPLDYLSRTELKRIRILTKRG